MRIRIIHLIDFPLPFMGIKDIMPINVSLTMENKKVQKMMEGYVEKKTRIDAPQILRALKRLEKEQKRGKGQNEKRKLRHRSLIITDKKITYKGKSILGLSEKNGNSIVSTHMLQGGDTNLNEWDALKVMAHELGHGLGMGHCKTKGCLMTKIETKRDLDRQKLEFCNDCKKEIRRIKREWKA